MNRAAALLAAVLMGWQAAPAPAAVEAGGYLKAAWFGYDSRTDTPLRDDYGLGVVRFRLDLRADGGPFRLECSPEARFSLAPAVAAGRVAAFGSAPAGLLDLERDFLDRDGREGTILLDRLSASLDAGPLRLIAGRQPIGFGAGLFWSPTDLLAPFSPREPDREVRPGTDAIRVLHSPTPLSEIGALWAPGRELRRSSILAQARFPAGPAEAFVIGGLVGERRVLGGSLTGELRGTGLRAEWRFLEARRPGGRAWGGVALGGLDRRFDNGLHLAIEYLRNGPGGDRTADYGRLAAEEPAALGLSPFLGRDYLLGRLSRRLDPLVEGAVTAYANLRDGSLLVWPQVSVSLSDEAEGAVFLMLPAGDRGTEFGEATRTIGFWLTLHF